MTWLIVWVVGAFLTAVFVGLLATIEQPILDRVETYLHIFLWPFFWTAFLVSIIKLAIRAASK